MINISNVSIFFPEKTLFENLNWQIPRGSRIGLVGNNGTGKTTLFRVVAGTFHPDKGEITTPKNRKIGYLPQDIVELGSNKNLLLFLKEKSGMVELENALIKHEKYLSSIPDDSLKYQAAFKKYEHATHLFEMKGGYTFSVQSKKMLKGLGFKEKDFSRSCSEFSGGWKMRIFLTSLLLSSPDILLLDEPTNHLDTESLEWLENWLIKFPGTIITVSHDRYFLDKLVTQIAELDHHKLTIYKGNYSWYLKDQVKRRELLLKQLKTQESKIAKTERFIERFRYKNTKSVQVQSRIKMLQKMPTVKIEKAAKNIHIRFPECPRSGDSVVTAKDLGKAYFDNQVFSHANFTLHRGEKVALVGVNGAGKSTLSRLINQKETPSSGSVTLGHKVNMAFFSQESAQNLNYKHSIWQEISAVSSPMLTEERRTLLGAFLFSGDSIHKPINVLSGGEKSRVTLAKMLMEKSNFLILDEPTNHLDIATKDLFQKALLKYKGTILIVSHDRYFLDNLIYRVMEIRDGQMIDYPGNYSYFVEKRTQLLEESANSLESLIDQKKPAKQNSKITDKEKKRKEAEQRNRNYKQNKEIFKTLKAVKEKINALEKNKAHTENQLCDPVVLKDSTKVKNLMLDLKKCNHELIALIKIRKELNLKKI
jgi:ATP-binding cassette subfamily F protein 3